MSFVQEWWESSRLQEHTHNIAAVVVLAVLLRVVLRYVYVRYLRDWGKSVKIEMDTFRRFRQIKYWRKRRGRPGEPRQGPRPHFHHNHFMQSFPGLNHKRKIFAWGKDKQDPPNQSLPPPAHLQGDDRLHPRSVEQTAYQRNKGPIVRVTVSDPGIQTIGLRQLAALQQERIRQQQRQREMEQNIRQTLERERLIALDKERKVKQEMDRAHREAQEKAAAAQKQRREREEKEKEAERLRKIKEKQEEDKRQKAQEEKRAQQQKDAQAAARKKKEQEEAEVKKQMAMDQQRKGQAEKLITKAFQSPNEQLLECYIQFAESNQQGNPIPTAMNSIGDVRKNIKDIFSLTDSLLESFSAEDPDEENTFMVKMWQMIVNTLFKAAKKEGFEETPPTSEEVEIYKNMVNGFALMVNLMRVRGQERLWLYMFGKTLGLVDFIYKRKESITTYKQLDLVRKNYLGFNPNFEKVYTSRLDQITYFLFALLALEPYASFMEIIERNGDADADTMRKIQEIRIPWDYSPFWVLVTCVRKAPFRYFKPICYSNIFSVLYLKYREALKTNTVNKSPFALLYQQMVKESQEFGPLVDKDPELAMLRDIDEQDKFNGDDFFDTVEPMTKNMYRTKRRMLAIKDYKVFEKEASPLYYFKPFEVQFA